MTQEERHACNRYVTALAEFEAACKELKDTFDPKFKELYSAGMFREAKDYVEQMPVTSVERTILLATLMGVMRKHG